MRRAARGSGTIRRHAAAPRGRGLLSLALALLLLPACAVHYYDHETGFEHVWGFGHMKMRAAEPNEGLQAVVTGADVFGLSLGVANRHRYLTAGWHRVEEIEILQESTSIRLEYPDGTFANVRIGSEFPLGDEAADDEDPAETPSDGAVDEEERGDDASDEDGTPAADTADARRADPFLRARSVSALLSRDVLCREAHSTDATSTRTNTQT